MTKDLRRQLLFFLIFAGIITILLLIFPFVEPHLTERVRDLFSGMAQPLLDEHGHEVVENNVRVMTNPAVNLLGVMLKIVKIILWMSLVVAIVRFVNALVFGAALKKAGASELSTLIRNVVSIIIYVVAFATIVKSQFNTDLTTLFAGSTIVGVVLGLAMQDTLGNLFAGIAMQADQPFQIGDVITLTTHSRGGPPVNGVVESVSWRGIKIRTFQNKLLVISNSVLGKELIEVAPRDNLNARLIFFNTLYTNSPAKTVQAVREVVRNAENVSPAKRPIVRVRNLGDNGIDWEIKYWLEDYTKYNDTDALIRQRIWYAFQREGIDFAYPTRTLYMKGQADDDSTLIFSDEIFERLSNVPLFEPLSDEETDQLAKKCLSRIFAPGEAIVRKGQKGASMYVVHRGSVKIQLRENNAPKTVATLSEGEFFGEMGLFTGEPRRADVVAAEETEVLEITHEAVKPLLDDNPDLAGGLAETIARRSEMLAESMAEAEADTAMKQRGVFDSIKNFFGLK